MCTLVLTSGSLKVWVFGVLWHFLLGCNTNHLFKSLVLINSICLVIDNYGGEGNVLTSCHKLPCCFFCFKKQSKVVLIIIDGIVFEMLQWPNREIKTLILLLINGCFVIAHSCDNCFVDALISCPHNSKFSTVPVFFNLGNLMCGLQLLVFPSIL